MKTYAEIGVVPEKLANTGGLPGVFLGPFVRVQKMDDDVVDGLEYWRLCEDFTVIEAALLIIGADPTDYYETEEDQEFRPKNFTPTFSALKNAILQGNLKATIRFDVRLPDDYFGQEYDSRIWVRRNNNGPSENVMVKTTPSWSKTTIAKIDLISWLESRGFTKGFFFPKANNRGGPDYLDRYHEKYAPKLAAAVNAWLAVANDPTPSTRTPKQRLEAWLRNNADEYELTKDDGNPNETGIEEITKVANWKTGGPSKTPQ